MKKWKTYETKFSILSWTTAFFPVSFKSLASCHSDLNCSLNSNTLHLSLRKYFLLETINNDIVTIIFIIEWLEYFVLLILQVNGRDVHDIDHIPSNYYDPIIPQVPGTKLNPKII